MSTPRYGLRIATRKPLRETATAPATEAAGAVTTSTAQAMHRMVVALGSRCPALPWYCDDYPLTSPESLVLSDLHDSCVALGATCDPATLDAATLAEAGKRHKTSDQSALDRAHDALVEAGATCSSGIKESVGSPATRQPLIESAARVVEALHEAQYDGIKRNVTFTIIQPGFNTSQTRFYTPEAVQSIAAAMLGQKMYLNHPSLSESLDRPERSLKDWVSTIEKTWVESDGRARGRAHIHDADFLAAVESLAAAGLIDRLGASINAMGLGALGTQAGCDTFIVEAIDERDPFRSVDWVTEPGAGGRAELLEAAQGSSALQPEAPPSPEEPDAMTEEEKAAAAAKMTALEAQVAALATANATMLETLQGLAGPLQEATRGRQIDALLAQVKGGTAGAKAAAREALLADTDAPTAERAREAVRTQIQRAAEVLGQDAGVTGFGFEADGEESAGETGTAELQALFEATGLTAEQALVAIHGR